MNAIVINLGGLSVAHLGCYGNSLFHTRHLDRLAAEGFVFDQCFAHSPSPTAARRAWWTGRHQFLETPGQTGALMQTDEPGGHPAILVGLLQAKGVQTILIHDWHGLWAGETQAELGLDRIIELESKPPDSTEQVFQSALHWLQHEAAKGPYLLFLDCCGIHRPGDPAAIDSETIEYLDAQIGAFRDRLSTRGVWEQSLLLITSDFGEPFVSRGAGGPPAMSVGETAGGPPVPRSLGTRPAHASLLHEEQVHVPLLLYWPGVTEPASRSPAVIQAVDVMPTVLEAFGVAAPPGIDGRSLLPIVRFDQRQLRDYACMGVPGGECAIRTAQWHLIWPQTSSSAHHTSGPQLYVKPDDRWERNDVANQFPEVVEQLGQILRSVAGSVLAGED